MIRIANAPCSWGALEFDLDKKPLGYQQVLEEIVDTGYAGTELGDWGFMPTEPDELKKVLNEKNLELLVCVGGRRIQLPAPGGVLPDH